MSDEITLPAQVAADKLTDVPEAFRGLYGPVEGVEGQLRPRITTVGGIALEDVGGLTATLTERKQKHQAASAKVAAVQAALGEDLTIEDLADTLTEWRRLKTQKPGKGGGLSDEEVQRRVAEALGGKETAWNTERDKLVGERDGALGQLDRHIRIGVAQSAIVKNEGNLEILLPHVLPRIGVVVDDSGERRAVVVDEKGNPVEVVKDGKLVPVDPADFVSEQFKGSDTFGPAFKGVQAAGSGSRTSTKAGGPGGINPFAKSTFSLTEISKLARDNPDQAKALMAAARQAGTLDSRAARMFRDTA